MVAVNSAYRITSDHRRQALLLPEGVHLYVSCGLPEVFRRLAGTYTEPIEYSWLHVPWKSLQRYIQNQQTASAEQSEGNIASEPDCIDDLRLYPVFMDHAVAAVVVQSSGAVWGDNPSVAASVKHIVRRQHSSPATPDTQAASRFVTALFKPDSTFETFTRRMLNVLVDQHQESLAALYSEVNGIFCQSLVVGSLFQFDALDGELTLATSQAWMSAVEEDRHFVPADLLPEHPVLLETPPRYLFLHRGPRSQRTQYLLAAVFPGDIGRAALANMKEIARLSSMLRDSQFSASSELLSLFLRLSDLIDDDVELEEIMRQVYGVLDSQMVLSRLVLALPDGRSCIIGRRPGSQPRVRLDDRPVIAASLRRLCSDEKPCVVANIVDFPLSDDDAKRYYVDDVKSETIVPLRLGAQQGLMAIGTPVTGNYLSSLTSLISSVARFLSLWYDLADQTRVNGPAAAETAIPDDTVRLRNRLQTMYKLTGGDSKDILGLLSEIRRQTTAVRDALATPDGDSEPTHLHAVIGRIAQTVEQACGRIGRLRDICALTEECFAGDVSIRAFLTELPAILKGYTDQSSKSRNVAITVDTSCPAASDFAWPWSALFDHILRPLLDLVDRAVRSGSILVEATADSSGEAVTIEFEQDLLGDSTVEDVLPELLSPDIPSDPVTSDPFTKTVQSVASGVCRVRVHSPGSI